MVRIIVPSVWTRDGQTRFQGTEGPLHELIKGFAAAHPDFRRRLLGPDSEPVQYINICVDEELIPRDRRADTVVEAGSTVTVIAPMAGG